MKNQLAFPALALTLFFSFAPQKAWTVVLKKDQTHHGAIYKPDAPSGHNDPGRETGMEKKSHKNLRLKEGSGFDGTAQSAFLLSILGLAGLVAGGILAVLSLIYLGPALGFAGFVAGLIGLIMGKSVLKHNQQELSAKGLLKARLAKAFGWTVVIISAVGVFFTLLFIALGLFLL